MTSEQVGEKSASGFVFKVLNGALNGIEFSLGQHDYFMCVGDAGAQQGNLTFSERTLYLPTSEPANNFIVKLTDVYDDSGFDIVVCFAEHQETKRLEFNQICLIEGVYFAVRREDEIWSEEVQNGLLAPPLHAVSEALPAPTGNSNHPSSTKSKSALLLLLLLAAIGAAVFLGWKYYPVETKVAIDKQRELVGDRDGYFLQLGNDNVYYLFAGNVPDAEWAQQALRRKKMAEFWTVVTPQGEEARLANLLERHNVAFFAIRFPDPVNPTLLMSRTRNTTDEKNLIKIKQLMLEAMPYAQDLHIVLYDDTEVLNKAQQGLKALGFDYRAVQSESGVTLVSGLPSVDVHLSEFSRFVTQFYQTWGRRYIHFSADIRDDTDKDKSFKYGADGVITMSKSHWFFNKKFE